MAGGGETADLIRSLDWSQTPLGPLDQWPQSLKTATNLMLNARQPMWIGWGPSVTFLYNDAYIPVLSLAKHPWALGKPTAVVWEEIWDFCGPLVDKVFSQGEASFVDDVRLFMSRGDFLEETFYSFSYSPIRDETGQVAGLFCPNTEVTAQNLNTRRLATLSALAANALIEKTIQTACASAAQTLAQNPNDIPFALLYLTAADRKSAHLEQAVRLPAGNVRLSPSVVLLDGSAPGPLNLPLADVMQQGKSVAGTLTNSDDLPPGPAGQPINQAVVLPLITPGQDQPIGILVAGVNPTRPLDADYRTFYELVANQVATAIQNAQAAEEERQRIDQLAELNQAKTLFFSNISHEFRTPLTLMLGPLEDLLRGNDEPLSERQRTHAEAAHRNARRLLRLVNTLLDFSRLEGGRLQANFTPTDLPTLTTDLASSFRSVVEKAGMQLVVETEPLARPVAVDRDMWEKIVLNLLSNAFKFTLSGTITVRMSQPSADQITLTVQDTGVGISEADLPRLFERFYRVEGSRGRSFEGTGIGLALVNELVELHGGSIRVNSELGKGSAFTVQIPTRQIQTTTLIADASARNSDLFVADADLMMAAERHSSPVSPSAKRILLADDNADMRAYIHRLLSPYYVVDMVADGRDALTAIRQNPPDLLLSDIMMPHLSGTELLKVLKTDPQTGHIPIMLLSARAGEEATLDGYSAGADDYLTKPFSANELLARVQAQLKLAQARQENQQKLRHLLMQAPVAIAIFRGPDFVVELANEQHLQFWNRSHDEVIGRPVFEAIPEAAGQGYETILEHVLISGELWIANEQYVELIRNGKREGIWVDVIYQPLHEDGHVTGIMEVVHDVTQQVVARQAIETSRQRFQTLLETIPQMTWTNTLEGEVNFYNQRWYNYTGLSFEQTRDWGWQAVVHPDDLPQTLTNYQQALTTGNLFMVENRYRRADGQYRWHLNRALPLQDDEGQITGWVGTATDIDDQKRVSEELERRVTERTGELRSLNAELERSNFDLMQFASVASHDLKEPLRKIQAFSTLLKTSLDEKLDEEEHEHFRRIIRAAARMQTLVDDVLRLSKLSKIDARYEPVDLNGVISRILDDLEIAIEEKKAVIQVSSLPTIEAIPGQMHQLFQNLISNALKFSGNRLPIVTIESSPISSPTQATGANQAYVAIYVRDNGIGFEMQYVEKIFGMFQRLHRREHYEGTGIGLTICRRIVENHHGSITAEGRLNEGATFQIVLPVSQQPL